MKKIVIGLDFDNTIVCYDEVFHAEATRRHLIPSSTPVSKEKVRQALVTVGKEDLWTELQGYVYGKCMDGARLFPGFVDFISRARSDSATCVIISHKTKVPYRGPAYDLHDSALHWLRSNGFFSAYGFSLDDVNFLESKQLKLRRIAELGCTYFIDDLIEFLSEKEFHSKTTPILLAPEGTTSGAAPAKIICFRTWDEINAYVFGQNR